MRENDGRFFQRTLVTSQRLYRVRKPRRSWATREKIFRVQTVRDAVCFCNSICLLFTWCCPDFAQLCSFLFCFVCCTLGLHFVSLRCVGGVCLLFRLFLLLVFCPVAALVLPCTFASVFALRFAFAFGFVLCLCCYCLIFWLHCVASVLSLICLCCYVLQFYLFVWFLWFLWCCCLGLHWVVPFCSV